LHYYALANGIIGGICLGFGILFLFVGFRRKDSKRLNSLFALFALAYAATLFNGIRFHDASSVEQYIRLARWDIIPVFLIYTSLIWYVAEYTKARPRIFLWGLTTLFLVIGIAQIVRGNLLYEEILGMDTVILPWGEQLAYLEATDSIWSLLLLGAQLAVLVFMVYACIRQYLRGERREALILSIGVLWFVVALGAELLGLVGVIPLFFYGEFGFLGFVVALSLQMSNEVIKTEEDLVDYRVNLEGLVKERTADLEATQEKLLLQTRKQAAVEERNRLAQDLHDVVSQILFSINLIAISLPRLWKRDPVMAERSTNELQRLTRGALAEMRILLRELRPHTIAEVELGTLLTQLSESISARHDIVVDLQACSECYLPLEVHVALYRIAQEATNNITKHAEASLVKMDLDRDEKEVRLAIFDDGCGFDVNEVLSDNMGLDIMQERANAISADLTINSRPGAGTTIAVTWPIPQTGKEENE
jgi:signal transduction histidine kinase